MKNLILLGLFLCPFLNSFAQDTYTMTIINTMGQPVKAVEVTAVNGDLILKKTTNNFGTVVFTFEEPGTYSLSYLDQLNVGTYQVREGFTGTGRRTFTYDPDGHFAVVPKEDRSGVNFTTLNALSLRNEPKTIKVTLNVKERSGVGVSSLPVTIVSVAEGLKIEGRSNSMGQAVFYLKNNTQYEVDINGVENVHKFKVPNFENGEMRESVYYEKTKVVEVAKGDTIIQRDILNKGGTTGHVHFTMTLRDYEGMPLNQEPVYAKADGENLVYESVTNAAGEVTFMLKKGNDYFINLKYEDNVALIECKDKKGFAMTQISRRYRGSDLIEQMLEEQRRRAEADSLGFLTYHHETPIFDPIKPTDYITKTANGIQINFGGRGPMGTPTVVDNRMYVPQQYYSPYFYCLDATTGEYIWGIQLGESGPSPAVYHDGVLLINTESCTLYAIDAETGKLLWSKWLAGYLYTTPSADGSRVFAVYENPTSNDAGDDRVIACFDLKTGAVNWMKWLDNEAIAAPVVVDNEVHIASHSGSYYVFDKRTGREVAKSLTIQALSSPTVTENEIFITTRISGKEQLVTLDRKSLEIKRKYSADLDPNEVEADDLFGSMNFNGSHPIVYKNEYVFVLDKNKLRAFDAKNEKLLWEKPINAHPNQIPLIIDDKVIVAGNDGKILSFKITNGAQDEIASTEGQVDGQPIANKGKLILSAAGVVSIIRAMITPKWDQWNKDPKHNLLID